MRRSAALVLTLSFTFAAGSAAAQTNPPPELHLHQSYIEEVTRPTDLDVKDPLAVLAYVLNALPQQVKVYPTENYFYFSFVHGGIPYAGNIRLDASNRDQGKVQFGYFEQTTQWLDDTPTVFRELDAKDGVKLEKVERFLYRLTYKDKSVLFALNDLSNVKPPATAVAPGEQFIGPVFDDSGIRFFLMFNPAVRSFLFVLDETVPVADQLLPNPRRPHLWIGKRTGFIYYADHRLKRKILVGVYEDNVRVNNYFDGPFDQLPDNFIEGETLRNALLQIQPSLKGQIDRFGGTPDGEVRYMIAPYKTYKEEREFDAMDRCANRRAKGAKPDYYRCFVTDEGPQDLGRRPSQTGKPSGSP